MSLKSLFLLLLLASMISCAPRKKSRFYEPKQDFRQSAESFVLNHYDVYTYMLCSRNIGDRNFLQNCHTSCNQGKDKDVIEEVYFLIPKDEKENRVIYFTTLSFLKQAKQKFHEADYDNSIFLSDLDYLFIGKLEANQILFPAHKKKRDIQWEIRRDSCSLEVLTVPNLHLKKYYTQRVTVAEVLKDGVTFYKSDRQVAFKKNSNMRVKDCPQDSALLMVDTLWIQSESNRHKIVFQTENTTDCKSLEYISFNNGQLLYY